VQALEFLLVRGSQTAVHLGSSRQLHTQGPTALLPITQTLCTVPNLVHVLLLVCTLQALEFLLVRGSQTAVHLGSGRELHTQGPTALLPNTQRLCTVPDLVHVLLLVPGSQMAVHLGSSRELRTLLPLVTHPTTGQHLAPFSKTLIKPSWPSAHHLLFAPCRRLSFF
jgi:hypothetical protein